MVSFIVYKLYLNKPDFKIPIKMINLFNKLKEKKT